MSCSRDWADRCQAAGGLVVGAHFPLPTPRSRPTSSSGRIDADRDADVRPGAGQPADPRVVPLPQLRLPAARPRRDGQDVGRGAARRDPDLRPDSTPTRPPTFEAWAAAVRAGRTFATSGPVLELAVDGHEPGDVIRCPAAGRRPARDPCPGARRPADRRLAWRSCVNGRVVAREDAARQLGCAWARDRSRSTAGAWIAARSRSEHEIRSAFATSDGRPYVAGLRRGRGSSAVRPDDAAAILAVIDGTARWIETMAAVARSGRSERGWSSGSPPAARRCASGMPHDGRMPDMKIALDPYMLRDRPFARGLPDRGRHRLRLDRAVAAARLHPVLHPSRGPTGPRWPSSGRRSSDTGMELASILPLYRWSSPDEDERQAAVRYWKRAIQLARRRRLHDDELRVQRPARAGGPERGAVLAVDGGAPADLRARGDPAQPRGPSGRLHRAQRAGGRPRPGDRLAARRLRLLRPAHVPPRRRHRRDDRRRRARPRPGPHRRRPQSSGLVRPALHRQPAGLDGPRPPASRHRPGRGRLRRLLRGASAVGFDGILTSCVFAWEERAVESSRFMFERIRHHLDAALGDAAANPAD